MKGGERLILDTASEVGTQNYFASASNRKVASPTAAASGTTFFCHLFRVLRSQILVISLSSIVKIEMLIVDFKNIQGGRVAMWYQDIFCPCITINISMLTKFLVNTNYQFEIELDSWRQEIMKLILFAIIHFPFVSLTKATLVRVRRFLSFFAPVHATFHSRHKTYTNLTQCSFGRQLRPKVASPCIAME